MTPLPFKGGRVRFATGEERYPSGGSPWRCSACGRVGPWTEGWGGYWSLRQEDDGLYADNGAGYPVWCSQPCYSVVLASGACSELKVVTMTRKRR